MKKKELEEKIADGIKLFEEKKFEDSAEMLIPIHVELLKITDSYQKIKENGKLTKKDERENEYFQDKYFNVLRIINKINLMENPGLKKKIDNLYSVYKKS